MGDKCILGIDPSLNGSGIVAIDLEGNPLGEDHIRLNVNKSTPAAFGMERISIILDRILWFVQNYEVTGVAIEGYSFGSKGRALFDLGELGGVIRHTLYIKNIPYTEIPPKALKKYISGNGNADKEEMMKSVESMFGVKFDSHDLADAYSAASMLLKLGEDGIKALQKPKKKKRKAKKKKAS